MSVKELRIAEINSQIDRAIEDRNDNVSIPLETIKNFMISCGYRGEDKPFGKPYASKGGSVFTFLDETTIFGFDIDGVWVNTKTSEPLSSDFWQPYPQEKWDAMLLEYAKGKYDVYCFDPLSICAIHTDKPKGSIFILDGSVWFKTSGVSYEIFDSKTGVWAEIIETKEETKEVVFDFGVFTINFDTIDPNRYTLDEWIEIMKLGLERKKTEGC